MAFTNCRSYGRLIAPGTHCEALEKKGKNLFTLNTTYTCGLFGNAFERKRETFK